MNIYQLLDWDSNIFGFQVAKIIPERLTATELTEALADLKKQGAKLVFWAADSEDAVSQQAAVQHQGFCADRKVTYLMYFSKNFQPQFNVAEIAEYAEILPNADLELLALQSGLYSRFKADPKIPEKIFEQIYKTWIANSTNKTVARKTLVIHKDDKIAGMVTLGEKNQRGDIGLLAVHSDYRNLGIGKNLVGAAQQWCIEQNYSAGQVVTQMDNLPASALYEKCGYSIEKVENFYHFWL